MIPTKFGWIGWADTEEKNNMWKVINRRQTPIDNKSSPGLSAKWAKKVCKYHSAW